jgi:hypothetical protein
VVGKSGKKATTPATKRAPAAAYSQLTLKAPSTKNDLNLREHRVVMKRESSLESYVSVRTTAKERTTPNLSPRPFLIGQNPSFSASPPLFIETGVCPITFIMSSHGNKGKKKTTFNPDVPPFKWSDIEDDNTGIGSLASPSTSKRPRSHTTSSLPAYQPESNPLTYWKRRLQKKSPKDPGASTKDLLSTFVNFLADIQKDYTQRFDTLTAHIVTLVEGNREATSGLTQLAGQLSTFSAEVY